MSTPRPAIVPAGRRWGRRWISDAQRLARAPASAMGYARDLRRFRELERVHGEARADVELYPQLTDATEITDFDPHYVLQGGWAMRHLLASDAQSHVDVGSLIGYLPFFASAVPTTFIDIRPSGLVFPGLDERVGSVLGLPFPDRSLLSVSSLHVVEHIGLGRYGDPLDPAGMRKACAELARVVAPGGRLYLSTPVGRPRVCFNAHRVSLAEDVTSWVGLPLVRFDAVMDNGRYAERADMTGLGDANYALGLFCFER